LIGSDAFKAIIRNWQVITHASELFMISDLVVRIHTTLGVIPRLKILVNEIVMLINASVVCS